MSKSLIITCTNLGASHSANYAIYEILNAGLAKSASIMIPCPWSREASQAESLKNISIGVQLTLNAEYENYRWGPITQSSSLLDGNGGFPKTLEDLWEHADPKEVWRECRSQIERALLWGLKISHLGSHLDALLPRPEYFDIYLELSKEFNLPIRLSSSSQAEYGFPVHELIKQANVMCPDEVIALETEPDISALLEKLVKESSSNKVTEILCAPLFDSPEARAIHPTDYSAGILIKEKLEELNRKIEEKKDLDITLTNWSELLAKK